MASAVQRPLIEGGLWWNGDGTITDMQVANNEQVAPLSDISFTTITAVGASGNILVNRCALSAKTGGTQSIAGVYALGMATLIDSGVSNSGGDFTLGVFAEQNAVVESSIISVIGNDFTYGVYAQNSNATVNNSHVTVEGAGFSTHAVFVDGDATVSNSILNAFGNGTILGVHSLSGNTTINNTTISANSTNGGAAFGVVALGNVNFEGTKASHVSASTSLPGTATAVLAITGQVNNNSKPKSQCSTNGGPESDCG